MTKTTPNSDISLTSDRLLSLSEVHALTGRDRKTLTKWIKEGRYPNAVQEPGGRNGWRIPVRDLVAAGDLDAHQVVEVATTLETLRETKLVVELRNRITELESALQVQSALADERRSTATTLQNLLGTVLSSGGTR